MIFKLFKLIYKEHTVGNPPKKKGQRVLLMHDSPYIPDNANPKEGSSYHCEGVVESVIKHSMGGQRVVIQWDNGSRNDYRAIELRVIPFIPDINWQSSLDSDNPNITFKERKESQELVNRAQWNKELLEPGGAERGKTTQAYYTITTSGKLGTWG